MSLPQHTIISTLRTHIQISRTNSTMSERQPLLAGGAPTRRDVDSVMSKGQRIRVAQVAGAFGAGRLP